MLDIVSIQDGEDLGFADSAVMRAGNVLSVQLGSLEYAPDFGVDLKFFIQSSLQFQNSSFRAYLVERLTNHQINVSEVIDQVNNLFERYTFFVGDANTINVQGLIR